MWWGKEWMSDGCGGEGEEVEVGEGEGSEGAGGDVDWRCVGEGGW